MNQHVDFCASIVVVIETLNKLIHSPQFVKNATLQQVVSEIAAAVPPSVCSLPAPRGDGRTARRVVGLCHNRSIDDRRRTGCPEVHRNFDTPLISAIG